MKIENSLACLSKSALACAFVFAVAGTATAAPATGESWAYRVVNRYNGDVRGNVRYRVE